MTALDDFKRFVADAQAGSQYATWAKQNPGDLGRWQAFRDLVLAGTQAAPPTMATSHGRELVDAAVETEHYMALEAPTPAPVSSLGRKLPPRMIELPASSPVAIASTLNELVSALTGVGPGTVISYNGPSAIGQGAADAIMVATQGIPTAPVELRAAAGTKPTLLKLLHLTGGVTRIRGFTVDKNSYATDARLGLPAVPGGGNVGLWINGADVELDQCEIRNATMSGLFGMGDRVQVFRTLIHNNGTSHDDHGIYWGQGGAGALVANCVIVDNACFGFQIQYTSGGVVVANCTLLRNGKNFAGSGTVQAANARNVLYVNCIVDDNGEVGLKSYTSGVGNQISHCLAHGNPQGPTFGTFDSVTNLLTGDPLLDANYRPAAGSPMIGAADPDYCPPTDFYGTARKTADIGAVAA